MTALEEEAMKALAAESKMDISFINSLIQKWRANLEKGRLKQRGYKQRSKMMPNWMNYMSGRSRRSAHGRKHLRRQAQRRSTPLTPHWSVRSSFPANTTSISVSALPHSGTLGRLHMFFPRFKYLIIPTLWRELKSTSQDGEYYIRVASTSDESASQVWHWRNKPNLGGAVASSAQHETSCSNRRATQRRPFCDSYAFVVTVL